MKEILESSLDNIEYKIFKNGVLTAPTGSVTVTVIKNGVVVIDAATASTTTTGVYTYDLPYAVTVDTEVIPVTSDNGVLEVQWSFTLNTNSILITEYYDVVTPYALWDYFYAENIAYSDYIECERVSRYLINSYCGQSFQKEYTTYAIEGHGTTGLSLPRRLLTLEEITWVGNTVQTASNVIGYNWPYAWELAADGWIVRQQSYANHLDPVYTQKGKFRRNTTYNVKGVWGYDGVPTAVEEAAKILIADYICTDHKYRDKYLKSIKMDNWKLDFHDEAFRGTGNATVDKLLLDHRLSPGIGLI